MRGHLNHLKVTAQVEAHSIKQAGTLCHTGKCHTGKATQAGVNRHTVPLRHCHTGTCHEGIMANQVGQPASFKVQLDPETSKINTLCPTWGLQCNHVDLVDSNEIVP